MQSSLPGVYRALVVNTQDPLGKNRVRTQVPQVAGNAILEWAEPINPAMPVPNSGTVVWVMFNGGDIHKPLYFANSV